MNFKIKKYKEIISQRNNSLEEAINKTSNPYLKARFEWNNLFGDIRKAKLHWQWAACLALCSNLLLIIVLSLLSMRSQIVPYIVKVDELGNAIYTGFVDKAQTISTLEVNAFLRQFIINARSVISDPFAEKRAIDFVYGASLPPARKILDTYYRETNPFTISKEQLTEIQVKSVVQKSSHTWQLDWTEIHRSLDGQELSKNHFEALITIVHMAVKNPELLNINPLGIYIQHISWAQQE